MEVSQYWTEGQSTIQWSKDYKEKNSLFFWLNLKENMSYRSNNGSFDGVATFGANNLHLYLVYEMQFEVENKAIRKQFHLAPTASLDRISAHNIFPVLGAQQNTFYFSWNFSDTMQ